MQPAWRGFRRSGKMACMQAKRFEDVSWQRRRAVELFALAGAAVVVGCAGKPPAARSANEQSDEKDEAEVTPGEDLMQEHGLLERVHDNGGRQRVDEACALRQWDECVREEEPSLGMLPADECFESNGPTGT